MLLSSQKYKIHNPNDHKQNKYKLYQTLYVFLSKKNLINVILYDIV